MGAARMPHSLLWLTAVCVRVRLTPVLETLTEETCFQRSSHYGHFSVKYNLQVLLYFGKLVGGQTGTGEECLIQSVSFPVT